MIYKNLKFPKISGRPFFYTNFVQTLDGKVAVKQDGYWPIGSKVDYEVLTELRAYADALIHGGNLAREFGKLTLRSLNKPSFRALRKKLGKNPSLPYYIMSHKTTPKRTGVNVIHPPGILAWHPFSGSIKQLVSELHRKGYKRALVEGGPTLLGSFLKEGLIDEVFLTIAPKIYGTEEKNTLTMVEGVLFKPQQIKTLSLVSLKKIGSELFLRYKLKA